MKTKNIIIGIIFLFICSMLSAQSYNEEITVEGSYKPHIKKSERLIKTPENRIKEFKIPDYKASTNDYYYDYHLEIEPVSPVQYSLSNDIADITGNFIKVGLGSRLSPDFLFRHYSNLSRKTSLGVGVFHNSTWLDMKNCLNTKYMNNAFNMSLTNRFNNFQLRSFVDYHYDMYYLYGSQTDSTDITPNLNDPKRNIHAINAKILLDDMEKSYRSLHDEMGIEYHYTGIPDGTHENTVKYHAFLEHSNSWFKNKDNIQTIAGNLDIDVDNIDKTLILFALSPYFKMTGNFYRLHLGLRVDAKTASGNDIMGIYPDIQGSLYLFRKNLEFYAKLGGKTKINTFMEIISENPFIFKDTVSDFGYEKTKMDFQGGLKTKIANRISIHTGIRYREIDNHIFYVSYSNSNKFMAIRENCDIFNFIADVQFRIKDNLNITADFLYNDYTMKPDADTQTDSQDKKKPWYKPDFELTLKADYQHNEHWKFRVAGYVAGTRYALVNFDATHPGIEELKPLWDMEAGEIGEGRWSTVDGQQSMVNGQRAIGEGQRSTVNSQQEDGQRSTVNRKIVNSQQGDGRWSTGEGKAWVEELKPLCDIQIGCDYMLNKNLAFYFEIRNLVHNRYRLYYNYPSYGFQIFAGFKYKFL